MTPASITIAVKEPGQAPRLETIRYELKDMQELVGGYLEAVTTIPDLHPLVLWCNEDGLRLNLYLNLKVPSLRGEAVVGTVFISGPGDEEGETQTLTRKQEKDALAWLEKHGVKYA